MSQICARCGPDQLYGDDVTMCEKHVLDLEPYVPPVEQRQHIRVPAQKLRPGRAPCWNCGTAPAHPDNTECLNPDCRRSLTPPAMLVRFRDGQVEVDPGARAELGRHGRHARLFRPFPNVSRRHAVVGVDPDGRAWIEPIPTPNGTFIDSREIQPSVRRPLRTGHVVRFALHAEGTVTVFTRLTQQGDRT